MHIHSETVTETPRPSATVVLLRDAANGLEVFLVKRHAASTVLGGAWVFPGGKLDHTDTLLDDQAYLDAPARALQQALQEPQTPLDVAQGLFVAAIREAFEESGVLFANSPDTDPCTDPYTDRHAEATRLLGEGVPFNTILARLGLRLQTRLLAPWSRWVTPLMPSVSSKRFDTRFFVAPMPPRQVARHDNVETTHSTWIKPADALRLYWEHRIELAPPQIMTLAHLSRFDNALAVLDAARTRAAPMILPTSFDQDGQRVICYPGDPGHSVPERAMPGPTRLVFRNRRFEPPGGLQDWFEPG